MGNVEGCPGLNYWREGSYPAPVRIRPLYKSLLSTYTASPSFSIASSSYRPSKSPSHHKNKRGLPETYLEFTCFPERALHFFLSFVIGCRRDTPLQVREKVRIFSKSFMQTANKCFVGCLYFFDFDETKYLIFNMERHVNQVSGLVMTTLSFLFPSERTAKNF